MLRVCAHVPGTTTMTTWGGVSVAECYVNFDRQCPTGSCSVSFRTSLAYLHDFGKLLKRLQVLRKNPLQHQMLWRFWIPLLIQLYTLRFIIVNFLMQRVVRSKTRTGFRLCTGTYIYYNNIPHGLSVESE